MPLNQLPRQTQPKFGKPWGMSLIFLWKNRIFLVEIYFKLCLILDCVFFVTKQRLCNNLASFFDRSNLQIKILTWLLPFGPPLASTKKWKCSKRTNEILSYSISQSKLNWITAQFCFFSWFFFKKSQKSTIQKSFGCQATLIV